MNIVFKESPEQLELIRKMGSKNRIEAAQAQETFAALLAPTVGEVFNQADTTSLVYKTLTYKEGEDPSFPLELYTDVTEGHFTVWSQAMPGGLPTNTEVQPIQELKFTTYKLDSAISYLAKYAQQTRLPVIARAIERLMQEVMVKAQNNAWAVVLAALAAVQHNSDYHVKRVSTAGVLSLSDFNSLSTFFRRLNRSWVGGTPVSGVGRATDMIVSPEVMEQLRSLAYNPVNIKGAAGVTGTQYSGVLGLAEADRAAIYKTGGTPEFFGVTLHELLELGVGQDYNVLFDNLAGSNSYTKFDATGGAVFTEASEQIAIVLDASRDVGMKALATDSETGSVFALQPDDQFLQRSQKIGLYGSVEEGRIIVNTRGLAGLII